MKKMKHFLIYCGNPGIGKTYFCAALSEWAEKNFASWRYWKEADLLKRVRSSIDDYKNSDYLDALSYLIDDDLLMIDDIGSTGLNDWRREIIFALIDSRYNTMKPTILTSNFCRQQFEENFHERVVSRLYDKDNIIIEIPAGIDLRVHQQ